MTAKLGLIVLNILNSIYIMAVSSQGPLDLLNTSQFSKGFGK